MKIREILAQLRATINMPRKYASFYGWHDRSAAGKTMVEVDIVNDLLNAMNAYNHADYTNVCASNDNWPDVWFYKADGMRVPCEVTELVDKKALPAGTGRPWSKQMLIDELKALISRKGLRRLKGNAEDRSVLVIHTDETYLSVDSVTALSGDTRFNKPYGMERIFLLFTYNPVHGGYRYLEL